MRHRNEKEPNQPTNASTLRLKETYPEGAVVEFKDDQWAARCGRVVGAAKGMLVVTSPVYPTSTPKKAYTPSVRVEVGGRRQWIMNPEQRLPTPRTHRVPPERLGEILRLPRRRGGEDE
jgi:hypothetical protein